MLSAFTATLHVPNLSKPDHVLSVLDEQNDLFSKQDLATLAKRMSGHKYVVKRRTPRRPSKNSCLNFRSLIGFSSPYAITSLDRVFIGIKKLLDLCDMARQTEPKYRVIKFLTKLEEEGGLFNNGPM